MSDLTARPNPLASMPQPQPPGVASQGMPEAPPEPKTPTERLRISMAPGAWQVMLDLVQWAQQWQMTYEGKVPEWSEDLMVTLLRPFMGFGPHPEMWQYCVRIGVARTVVERAVRWTDDEKFRQGRPFPWIVISEVAPILSGETKGIEGLKNCHQALAEMEGITSLSDAG